MSTGQVSNVCSPRDTTQPTWATDNFMPHLQDTLGDGHHSTVLWELEEKLWTCGCQWEEFEYRRLSIVEKSSATHFQQQTKRPPSRRLLCSESGHAQCKVHFLSQNVHLQCWICRSPQHQTTPSETARVPNIYLKLQQRTMFITKTQTQSSLDICWRLEIH